MRDSIIEEMRLESEAKKQGKTYASGSALVRQDAKKIVLKCLKDNRVKEKMKDKDKRTCKFYPHFCDVVGHSTVNDKTCKMHNKSKAKRKIAEDSMIDMMIEDYLKEKSNGKIFFTMAQFL